MKINTRKRLVIILIFLAIILIFAFFRIYSIKPKENVEQLDIPKMYITGDIDEMQEKTDKRKIKVKYKSNDLSFESYAVLKVQGAYTLKFDKKNYNITFYEDSEYSKKKKIDIKWGEMSKYTLKANWMDQLHSRNIVTAQIASQINKKYGLFNDTINYGMTDGFPIEIYENGEFLGLYTLNIQKDYLFEMDEENEDNIAIMGSGLNYTTFNQLETEEWKNHDVEFGEANEHTLEKLNGLITFVKDSSDEEFVKNFEKHFNLDSVLNYYCLMQFAQLTDNAIRNIFLITYDGEIWYTLLYDLELSWGNFYMSGLQMQRYDSNNMEMRIKQSNLWNRFKVLFADKITERYSELRQDILTKENVLKKMNDFYSLIPEDTLEKEHTKWNNKPYYDLSYLEEYLDNRIRVVDEELGYNQ